MTTYYRYTTWLVATARQQVGISEYQLKAAPTAAPHVVDCSSFTQWAFASVGIILPRKAYRQMHSCGTFLPAKEMQAGDLVFRGGSPASYWTTCPMLKVDHVGLATDEGTVVHAANEERGVVEDSLERFMYPHSSRHMQGSLGLWAGRILA